MAAGPNNTQCVFFPVYAISDLASGTVLDLGNASPRRRLDAAPMAAFADAGPERAEVGRYPVASRQFSATGARPDLRGARRGRQSVSADCGRPGCAFLLGSLPR